jgi:hypothetical protein
MGSVRLGTVQNGRLGPGLPAVLVPWVRQMLLATTGGTRGLTGETRVRSLRHERGQRPSKAFDLWSAPASGGAPVQ